MSGDAIPAYPRVNAPCVLGDECRAQLTDLAGQPYATCAAPGCPEISRTLDPIRTVAAELARMEDAVLRRMLCAWDPAWGEPILVQKQVSADDVRIPRWNDEDQTYRARSRILGLGIPRGEGLPPDMKVFATDHIGADGKVLAPIPDRGMLSIFLQRLRK